MPESLDLRAARAELAVRQAELDQAFVEYNRRVMMATACSREEVEEYRLAWIQAKERRFLAALQVERCGGEVAK